MMAIYFKWYIYNAENSSQIPFITAEVEVFQISTILNVVLVSSLRFFSFGSCLTIVPLDIRNMKIYPNFCNFGTLRRPGNRHKLTWWMQMLRLHLGTRPPATTMRTGQWLPGSVLDIILHSAFIVQLRPQKDITVTSQWVPWRLKSPASQLFVQPFVQAHINKNIKALRHWSLWGNPSVIGGFPSHKGRVTQKMFPFDEVIMRQRDWQPGSFFDYNRLTTSPTKRAMLRFPARHAVPGIRSHAIYRSRSSFTPEHELK